MNTGYDDISTANLSLYQYDSCPYCARVRATLAQLQLDIEIRDTLAKPAHRQELVAGGGRSMVPCLRIDHPDGRVEWMYESADIIRFLRERFGS